MSYNKLNTPLRIAGMLLITALFTNCGKDNNKCLSHEQAYVSKVEGNKTGKVNQVMTFQVYFGCNSGCGQFGSFDENLSGNTRTVIVKAKYEGCICTADAPTRVATYSFTPSQPGTYYLKFLKTPNAYSTDTVTIN
ncbi:MAG: hypothetical protein K0Q79_658 [Flavipsychrobacter sp.]|jgi:hypothetical protein|nr:hypothetical protein [Flavipsychrobacter sp.]